MSKLNKCYVYFAIILLAIGVSSCSEQDDTKTLDTIRVGFTTADKLMMAYEFKRPARVLSINDTTLSTELNAPVALIHAHVGDLVEQDQPLIELDCRDESERLRQSRAKLSAAKATSRLAKLKYNRGIRLNKQKSISEQELNRLESEYQRAKADKKGAQASAALAGNNVNKCIIKAPFNAIVMERMATVGQLAVPGTAMIRVIDVDNLEVSAFLVAEEANLIHQAKNIAFQHNNQLYPLRIRALTAAIDNIRRTQEVRLSFTAKHPIPGSAGELSWTHPLPALPTEYISRRNDQLGILLASNVNNNIAEVSFHVLPNAREGQPALFQLPDNSLIITSGRFGINVGDKVRLVSSVDNTTATLK